MRFRRFLSLVSKDSVKNVYTLRHIGTPRLFLPTMISDKQGIGGRSRPMKDDCFLPLPEPSMNFNSQLRGDCGDMTFMPFLNKVIGTDTTGGALLYDPDTQAVHPLPSYEKLKKWVVSQAVGNKLYVIDELTNGTGTRTFEALLYSPSELQPEWHWHALPPPPPPGLQDGADDPTSIESLAAVAGGSRILVSARGSGSVESCTHSFDAERLVWRARPFDWVLPFSGCTEYVPELNKLWFGISSKEHGSVFCASDLSWSSESHPPVLHAALDDTAAEGALPEECVISAHAMHLGSGKFCVARIFSVLTQSWYEGQHVLDDVKQIAVLTGVEVTCGNRGKKLTMVQLNSESYLLCKDPEPHWVL